MDGRHIPINVGNVLVVGGIAIVAVIAYVAVLKLAQRNGTTKAVGDGGLHLLNVNAA